VEALPPPDVSRSASAGLLQLHNREDMKMVNWVGTPDRDKYKGTQNDDTLNGVGGNDHLSGENGHDIILGGAR
jgi:Ca2+-binding RTX toxin-like protein